MPRMRTWLAAVALGLVALLGLSVIAVPGATAPQARALSCIPVDIHDELRRADFVFIGTPVAEVGQGDHATREIVFEVELWVKGNLGTPVMVRGFEWSSPEIGRRMAMISNVDEDGVLRDNPCVYAEPETVLAIAALENEPRSDEPAALLIGGEFGDSRVMALDGRGRLVGFGPGDGSVSTMAACPGGQRVVELVADFMHDGPSLIAVRDTATLEVVREADLPFTDTGFGWPEALNCLDENGEEVLFGLLGLGIYRFAGDSLEALHEGSFAAFALSDRWAVVAPVHDEPMEGQSFGLSLLDLASGEWLPLDPLPEPTEPTAFAFSPDGAHLAYFGRMPYDSARESMLVHVFAVDGGDLVGTQRLPAPRFCDSCWGDLAWLDDDTLLVRDRRWDESDERMTSTVRIMRLPDLEIVEEWSGGQGHVIRVAAGILLSVDYAVGVQQLLATRIEDGRQVEVRVLATQNASALLALPTFDVAAAETLMSQEPAPTPGPGSPTSPTGGPSTPTTGSPPEQPPVTGQPYSDLIAPALLVATLAIVLLGGTFFWRRRARLG